MDEYGGKRLSMNSNIKKVVIFEDSWNAESAKMIVKNEPDSCMLAEDSEGRDISKFHSEQNCELNQLCNFGKDIKKEPVDNEQQFEGVNSIVNRYMVNSDELDYLNTPIKSEFIRDESNPSPFNEELFKHFSFDSLQTKADTSECPEEESRATVARTAFKQEFSDRSSDSSSDNTNDSEQLRKIPSGDRLGLRFREYGSYDENRIPVDRNRTLGPKIVEDDYVPCKKIRKFAQEYESDPEVLSKNTLGYDQPRTKVSLDQRSGYDTETPNKFQKYSKRDWDEVIKQWRLEFEQYDSKDSTSEVSVRSTSPPAPLPSSPPAPKETAQIGRPPSPPWPMAGQPAEMIPSPSSPRNEISSTSDRWTTDALICAIRANPPGHPWSPELRDALSALRPPHRPIGRCRWRLTASDGTFVRVWLPPLPAESQSSEVISPPSSPRSDISPTYDHWTTDALVRAVQAIHSAPQWSLEVPAQSISPPEPLPSSPPAQKETSPTGRPLLPPWPVAAQPFGIIPSPSSLRNEIPSSSDGWTTDALICAIRANPPGHPWSPELRDALSALRPPHRPIGRCRWRLTASDGTFIRVWLPPLLAEAQSAEVISPPSSPRSEISSTSDHWTTDALVRADQAIHSAPQWSLEVPAQSISPPEPLPSCPPAQKETFPTGRPLLPPWPVAAQPAGIIPPPSSPMNEIPSTSDRWTTDALVCALRENPSVHQWSLELKDALSALRPPDRPTGRCRRRLMASDGTTVRVWLPPLPSPRNEIPSTSDHWTTDALVPDVQANPSAHQWSLEVPLRSISPPAPLPSSPPAPNETTATGRLPSPPWPVAAQPAGIIPPPSSPRNEIPSTSDCWTTDALVCAIRAYPSDQQWSLELRDALSALRPPDRPTGRCRRRLMASDGTSVRVCLPPLRVAAHATEVIPTPSSPRNEISSTSDHWKTDALVRAVQANQSAHQWSLEVPVRTISSPAPLPSSPPAPKETTPTGRPPSLPRPVAAQPSEINPPPSSPRNEIPSTSDRWTTDALVSAVRANPPGHPWSPELRSALSALRPPDRPTGGCRRRLTASDGTFARVWLPPLSVAAHVAEVISPPSSPRSEISSTSDHWTTGALANSSALQWSLEVPAQSISPLAPLSSSPPEPKETAQNGRPSLPLWPVTAQPAGIIPPSSSPRNEIPSTSDCWTTDALICAVQASPSAHQWSLEVPVRSISPQSPLPSSSPAPKETTPIERHPSPLRPVAAQSSGIIPPPSSLRKEIPPTSDRWTTDALVCAIRAYPSDQQWSVELRDALSALRPPDRPTGRCRRRLMASDGTSVRVCLPSLRVAAHAAEVIPTSSSPRNEISSTSDHWTTDALVPAVQANTSAHQWSLEVPLRSISPPAPLPSSPPAPKETTPTGRPPSPPRPVAAQPSGINPPPSLPRNEITSDRWTTDALVSAVRANPPGHPWSPELRNALGALRPPNRPTGGCRRRLTASDGTFVRVWLPPLSVAAHAAEVMSPPSSPRSEISSTSDHWTTGALANSSAHQWSLEVPAQPILPPAPLPSSPPAPKETAPNGRPPLPPRPVAAQSSE